MEGGRRARPRFVETRMHGDGNAALIPSREGGYGVRGARARVGSSPALRSPNLPSTPHPADSRKIFRRLLLGAEESAV